MSNLFNTTNNIFKKYCLLFIFITFYISCTSKSDTKKNSVSSKLTTLTFKQKKHDFGEIPVGKNLSTLFKFLNTGGSPLLIKEVTTSCGCTVPEWPKEIVKPNESGQIKIVYDAKYPGRFNKTITVIYNGEDSPLQLTIKGVVPYPKGEVKSTSNKNLIKK